MFRVLSLTVLAAAGSLAARAADDPAPRQVELMKGDRILFFGDSLTALAGVDGPTDRGVTTGYVRVFRGAIRERHKDKDIEVDWVATGGHTVPDLLKRVDKDVIARRPTVRHCLMLLRMM